ncbi:MAG: 5-formyltetrahydrofolate cyclo-ligase [Planctomycetota bacterium]|jgi:5-formyltetrahydrofolate cyclo-ligase
MVDEFKADLRSRMRAHMRAMPEQRRHEASAAACSRLVKLEAFQHASVVMLYMPLATEVDLTPAAVRCFQLGKTVCVPKVDWERRDMAAVEVSSFDDHVMDIDEHGLRSPHRGHPLLPKSIDLVVVPGLAFDAHGNRLGRGGGYYDRFLRRLRHAATTVGLAFDFQIVDLVPADDRDMSVDLVVTERRVVLADSSRSRR